MNRIASTRWLLVAALALAGCADADLVQNPLLDRWCGDRPCGWDVDGEIERVGTWHPNDYAVALVSDDARLHQLNAEVDASVDCFEFSMIAKIDERARVYVELDFLDDGVAEFSQRLRPTDYEPLRFLITTPTWYHGVRFAVRKHGPGKAVLGRMRVTESSKCTAPPLDLDHRPLAALCEGDDQCTDGFCVDSVCAGCRDAATCGAGESCGYVAGEHGDARACVMDGSVAIGAPCNDGAQCESGICCEGACSECCAADDCAAGGRCAYPRFEGEVVDPQLLDSWNWPKLCDPDAAARTAGELCVSDADCASGACRGGDVVCAHETCDPADDACIDWCIVFRAVTGQCD